MTAPATAPPPPLLACRDLGMVYASGRRALEGVDLELRAGDLVVVVGLSGSGKSTLVRCLNRLLEPTEGQVLFEERDVTHATGAELRRLRRGVAMIFQHFNLVKRASVLVNVLTGSLERQRLLPSLVGLFGRQDREEALENLRLVGLEDRAYDRADALSGGQQQRVAIARALMQRPRVLLADEPVASLDPATSHSVLEVLRDLQRDRQLAVLANLHFLSLAREYGTRAIALRDGRKVFEGPPSEIDETRFGEIYGSEAREVEVR